MAVVDSGEVNAVLVGEAFEIYAHTYRDDVLLGGFDGFHNIALISFQRAVFAGFDFEQVVVAGWAHFDSVAVTEVGLSGRDLDFVAAVWHPRVFLTVAGKSGVPLLKLFELDTNVVRRGNGFVFVSIEVINGPSTEDVINLIPVAGDERFAEPASLVVSDVSIFHTRRVLSDGLRVLWLRC